jgi:hypothetical protein
MHHRLPIKSKSLRNPTGLALALREGTLCERHLIIGSKVFDSDSAAKLLAEAAAVVLHVTTRTFTAAVIRKTRNCQRDKSGGSMARS